MWGNRLGWTISALIVLATAGLLWLLSGIGNRSKPTTFSRDEHNFAELAIPKPPLIPSTTQPTAAGPTWRSATDAFDRDRALYEDFAITGSLKAKRVDELAAVEVLVGASELALPGVFASNPEALVNYNNTKPPLEALRILGRVMVDRLALLHSRDPAKRDLAEKYARAGAVLGDALSRERLTYDEFALGQELLGKSAFLMARFAEQRNDTANAWAWRDFEQRRQLFVKEQIEPTLAFVRSIDAKVVGTRTGDVFELARRSKERMWRVEAVMALGRVRYFVGTSESAADQRAARAVVTELAEKDPDPIVRLAAKAARDLTLEQYRAQ
jgi:hypothetical protein